MGYFILNNKTNLFYKYNYGFTDVPVSAACVKCISGATMFMTVKAAKECREIMEGLNPELKGDLKIMKLV